MKRTALAVMFLAGCSSRPADRVCTFTAGGACVAVGPAVQATQTATDRQLRLALAYWGAPRETLDGWVLSYWDHPVGCNHPAASGCTRWDDGTIDMEALAPACPETAQLVHEIGHVLFHDPGHELPIWCWQTEQEATRAIVRNAGASPGCALQPWYTEAVDLARGCDGRGGAAPTPEQESRLAALWDAL